MVKSDIEFVTQLKAYLGRETDPNYKDKITNRAPSRVAIEAANNAVKYFLGDRLDGILGIFSNFREGEMPPKAEEFEISMKEVRDKIDKRVEEINAKQ